MTVDGPTALYGRSNDYLLCLGSKALLGVCLTDWGVYLLSTGQSHLAVHVLSRALQLSEEVLGPAHEQVLTACTVVSQLVTGAYRLCRRVATRNRYSPLVPSCRNS